MSKRVDIAIKLTADLEERLRSANSVSEACAVTKAWYAEIISMQDNRCADLAYYNWSIVRHLDVLTRAQIAEVAGEKTSDIVVNGDIQVGDQYKAGQAGAMGPGAKATHMSFNQKLQAGADLNVLASDLSRVLAAMKQRANGSLAQNEAVAAVGEAQEAAQRGDEHRVYCLLKQAGQWALDVAKDVTAEIAVKAISTSIRLPD